MWTTPFAPRAAPGSWMSRLGRLPPAGDRVRASALRFRSVPEPRTGGRAVTDVWPISLSFVSETVMLAPAPGTSTRNDALPSGAATTTSYVPIGTAIEKMPRGSVFACRVRLEPLAVTTAPTTGWSPAVTLPDKVLVAWASVAGELATQMLRMRASARSGPPKRRRNMVPFATVTLQRLR